jgi:hypothetical protein
MNRLFVLVSRFNWPHQAWLGRSRSEYAIWLNRRLELLRRFTAPSVRNCWIKPDLWVLLVDHCEFEFLPQLEKIVQGLPFRFVFFSGADIAESLRDVIAAQEFPLTLYTTRLDTDDLVASDFFARIRDFPIKVSEEENCVVLSFPGGSNYLVEQDLFYYSSYPENPFLTMVERLESPTDLRGVYWKMHHELGNSVSQVFYLRSYYPMWASLIHDSNSLNQSLTATNKIKLSDQDILVKRFGIAKDCGLKDKKLRQ